ncbi:hypothetical protein [Streptomyces sp. NPDC052225]|uniref:hypothetical protein n=1 Tax=Streptomyces sp. NPDC052225 TaxID=3154949 RepID=UPI00343CA148
MPKHDQDDEPDWFTVEPDDHDTPPAAAQQPGVHITVTPPPPPPADPAKADRRARIRRWLAVHGAAAAAGWYSGLGQIAEDFMSDVGDGAPMAALVLAGVAWYAAELAVENVRFMPSRLRPAARVIYRIPFATLLLAVALHAPRAAF